MKKGFLFLFIVAISFLFLINFVVAEEFGYNYLEKDKGLNQIPSTSSSTSSSSSGGGNTTQEIRNAVNSSIDYVFTSNKTYWWGELKSYLSGWFMNVSTVLTFNETKLNEEIRTEGVNAGFNETYNLTYHNYVAANFTNKTVWWADMNSVLFGWFRNNSGVLEFNDTMLATTYFNATESSVTAGTIDGGVLGDTQHKDGNYDGTTFNFSEVAGSPGLDLRMNFTDIVSFTRGIMRYKTSALSGAYPIIQVWDYEESVWEDYPPVSESPVFATIEQGVFDDDDHISGGVVQMRLYKASNGNTNNHYYIDWFAISKGYGTPSGEEVDPYAVHRDGSIELTANWDAGAFNITAQYFHGLFNWVVADNWLSFNGSTLTYNETRLNETIDLRGGGGNESWNESMAFDLFLNRTNEDLYTTTYNLTYHNHITINTTHNIGILYNLTSSIISNLTGDLINKTSNIQGLINSTSMTFKDVNLSFLNVSNNITINGNSICNSTMCFTLQELNTTGNGDVDTNCSDSSCSVVFYWANISLVNSTKNFGEIYNLTASIITNITGSAVNTTSNIQGLLNSTGIYDNCNVTGSCSNVTYLNITNPGSFNLTSYLDVEGHMALGVGAKVDSSGRTALTISETHSNPLAAYFGIRYDSVSNPTGNTSNGMTGVGGYNVVFGTTLYDVGTKFYGLDFGNWFVGNNKGNRNLTLTGIRTFGTGAAFSSGYAGTLIGLDASPFFNGLPGSSNAYVNESYGIYIRDAPVGLTTTNMSMLTIEKPTIGALYRNQIVLKDVGTGTGIRFLNETGPRIHANNYTDLVINSSTVYITNVMSALTIVDRSTEYDKLRYGEASQYLNDVSSRTTTLDSKGDVVYNHEADPEFLQYSYKYDCNCRIEKVCKDIWVEDYNITTGTYYNGRYMNACHEEEVCDTCNGVGRDIGATISWLRQVNYEQQQRINLLEQDNKLIKEELCKVNAEYIFCKV